MFLKQTSYKPRSNSLSSANDNPSSPTMSNNDNSNTNTVSGGKNASNSNALPSANRGGTGAAPTPANNVGGGAGWGDGGFTSGGRRRSSTNEGKFSGLNTLKRNSQDAGADAKKASFMEQKPGSGGVISNMWNNFTKGPTGGG